MNAVLRSTAVLRIYCKHTQPQNHFYVSFDFLIRLYTFNLLDINIMDKLIIVISGSNKKANLMSNQFTSACRNFLFILHNGIIIL